MNEKNTKRLDKDLVTLNKEFSVMETWKASTWTLVVGTVRYLQYLDKNNNSILFD